jgi:hypothetical protein
MAQAHIPSEKLEEIRQLAAGWGKIIAKRAFGEAGPGLDVNFHLMEQVAATAAQALTEGTLATLLEQQATSLPAHQPCPACGLSCPPKEHPREDRTIIVPHAQVPYHEPVFHCPACRKDFFPPPPRSGS